MPSAFSYDPAITTPGSSTDNAIVIFDGTGGSGFGNSTILVDSGGNGRIGIAGDTDVIIITANTVTVAGTVAATTLTGAGAGITALAAANITASGTLPALNGAALTALTAANITASGTLPALNGAALTALNADNIGSGTVPVARLGDGNESNSTFLRGDNTWAAAGANVKVGSFTRDTSAAVGTQVVSGIGFTPKSVIFLAVQDGTHEMSMGLDDGTDARVVHHDHPTTADTFALNTTKSIRTIHASGGNTFNGKITALASGQFTVTWDKVGSPTGTLTVMYMAFG